jgi:hypothetical protein
VPGAGRPESAFEVDVCRPIGQPADLRHLLFEGVCQVVPGAGRRMARPAGKTRPAAGKT